MIQRPQQDDRGTPRGRQARTRLGQCLIADPTRRPRDSVVRPGRAAVSPCRGQEDWQGNLATHGGGRQERDGQGQRLARLVEHANHREVRQQLISLILHIVCQVYLQMILIYSYSFPDPFHISLFELYHVNKNL